MFGDGSQQIHNIQMFSQLDHDLQLGHKRANLVWVGAGLGHLDGHDGTLLAGGQADSLCLQDPTERARPDLTTWGTAGNTGQGTDRSWKSRRSEKGHRVSR